MSQQELVILTSGITLLTGAIVLVALFQRRLKPLVNEYWQAKYILESIVTTFKRRYDELHHMNVLLNERVESNVSLLKEQSTHLSQLTESLANVSGQVDIIARSDRTYETEMNALRTEFQNVKSTLDANARAAAREAPQSDVGGPTGSLSPKKPSITQTDLTETEHTVLQLLKTQGPMTSRQIEVKIVKTREHTARLMKKLWQEGYVEREIHKTPFTYRLANGFHELEAQHA